MLITVVTRLGKFGLDAIYLLVVATLLVLSAWTDILHGYGKLGPAAETDAGLTTSMIENTEASRIESQSAACSAPSA